MSTGARAYPVLSRACIAIGGFFLLLSAFGNWRFGWSLASELIDKIWLALVYSGSDIAAGVLCATSAVLICQIGWRRKLLGSIALIPALLLVALSIAGTFGMMSGRIAVSAGHKNALQVDQGRVDWIRGTILKKDTPYRSRQLLIREERKASDEQRKQAAVVTDSQVVALVNAGKLIGLTIAEETAQVGITFMSSTVPMMVKFSGLWLGFFLFNSRILISEFSQNTHGGSKGSGNSGSGGQEKLSEKVRPLRPEPPKLTAVPVSTDAPKGKLTYAQFCHVIEQDLVHGEPASSTRALMAATGWSQSSVSRQLRKAKDRRNMRPEKRAYGGGGYYAPASG